MALLTYDWQQPNTGGAAAALRAGIELQQQDEENALRAQKIQTERNLAIAQELRLSIADRQKSQYEAQKDAREAEMAAAELAQDIRESDSRILENKAQAGYYSNRGTGLGDEGFPLLPVGNDSTMGAGQPQGESVDLMNAGAENAGSILGKVTDYGQQDDPYKDSASLGQGKYKVPTGAWNNRLSESSLAISPDVEAMFKQRGIKEGDPVKLLLSDGRSVTRTWDDRTMQDEQAIAKFGKPLRGRFDLYSPNGASPLRDAQIVGFEPVSMTMENTVPQVDAVRPAPVAETLRSTTEASPDDLGAALRSNAEYLNMLPPKMRAQEVAMAVRSRLRPQSQQSDLTEGKVPIPERGTYLDPITGIETAITVTSSGKQTARPYNPSKDVKVKVQNDPQGNLVKVDMTDPSNIQTEIIIPKDASVPASERTQFMRDSNELIEARADMKVAQTILKARQAALTLENGDVTAKDIQDAREKVVEAQGKMDAADEKIAKWTEKFGQSADAAKEPAKAEEAPPKVESSQIPTLKSKAEFDKLPSGAKYFRDGKLYQKP